MANGPVSGKAGIPIVLPANLPVLISGFTQSSATITVVVKDSGGNTVASGSGTGTKLNPMTINPSTFTPPSGSNGNYTVYITSNNGSNPDVQVLWSEDALNLGNTIYANTYTFCGEDWTDNDYNDIYLTIAWFAFAG